MVDRIAQTESYRVNLVVPQNAQIWQSSINLKLLKREADYYDKKITLVVADDRAADLASRLGFEVEKEEDFVPEPEPEAEAPAEMPEESEEEPLIEDEENIPVKEEPIFEEPEISENPPVGQIFDEPRPGKTEEEIIDDLWAERAQGKRPRQPADRPTESEPTDSIPPAGGPLIGIERPEQSVPVFLAGSRLSKNKKPRKRLDDVVRAKGKVNLFREGLLKSFSFKKKRPPLQNKPTFPRHLEKLEAIKDLRWSKYFALFIGLAIVVAFLVVYLVLPSAEIIIEPSRKTVSFDVLAVGSEDITEVDKGLNKIPLQRIRVSETKSEEFSSSGEKEINAKARGTIAIYNEYSSEPQTLVATTRFESNNGMIYRIEKNLVVPGAKIQEGRIIASSIEAEVAADLPGREYNVGMTSFTIPGFKGTPKYAAFYAKSKTEISGGATGKVKVVSANDLKNAEEKLKEELRDKVRELLEDQTPDNLKMLEQGSNEKITSVASAKENEIIDKFTMETTMSLEALLFREEDIKEIAELNLISQIGGDQEPLFQSQQVEVAKPVIDWDEGKASFYLHVKEDVIPKIDGEALKKELIGKDEVEVRKILSAKPEIKKATVSFRPFWVKKVPRQEDKIKITISID